MFWLGNKKTIIFCMHSLTKGLHYLENEEMKGIIIFYKDNYFVYLGLGRWVQNNDKIL